MKHNVSVKKHKDNTVTVRVDRQIETFPIDGMKEDEIVDRIRWSVVSMGASLDRLSIIKLVRREGRNV